MAAVSRRVRIDPTDTRNAVNALAEKEIRHPENLTQHMVGGWTLDYAAIDAKGLNREEVETFMARTLLDQPASALPLRAASLNVATSRRIASRCCPSALVPAVGGGHHGDYQAVPLLPVEVVNPGSVCSHGTP